MTLAGGMQQAAESWDQVAPTHCARQPRRNRLCAGVGLHQCRCCQAWCPDAARLHCEESPAPGQAWHYAWHFGHRRLCFVVPISTTCLAIVKGTPYGMRPCQQCCHAIWQTWKARSAALEADAALEDAWKALKHACMLWCCQTPGYCARRRGLCTDPDAMLLTSAMSALMLQSMSSVRAISCIAACVACLMTVLLITYPLKKSSKQQSTSAHLLNYVWEAASCAKIHLYNQTMSGEVNTRRALQPALRCNVGRTHWPGYRSGRPAARHGSDLRYWGVLAGLLRPGSHACTCAPVPGRS